MDSNNLTVFFVHGMGVRESTGCEASIHQNLVVKRQLPLRVVSSHWGEQAGAQIGDLKKVFPKRKHVPVSLTEEELRSDYLWRSMLDDHIFELRLFLENENEDETDSIPIYEQQKQREQAKIFTKRVRESQLNDELLSQLELAGIDKTFNEAREDVVDSDEYKELVAILHSRTGSSGGYLKAIARAVVARAVTLEASYDLPILFSREQRDRVIDEFCGWLGPRELGIADLLSPFVINALKYRLADGASPLLHPSFNSIHYKLGDTMYYLARGQQIRDYVRSEIRDLPGPIVLLTHSLGGTIMVDLLAEEIFHPKGDWLKKVKLLITVGSQVPYLYALNALCKLSRDQHLPATLFPRWINLYDPRDPLSFPGHEIFDEIEVKVEDRRIDSKKLFPQSHRHYWENEQTYDFIVETLRQEHLLDER